MAFDFTGKTAVVTGGAHGIGLAMARVLARAGARVAVFDREPASGFEDASTLVDVRSRESLVAAFAAIEGPDIVMANAGIGSEADLTATSEELWQSTLDVNLTGAFYTVQAAAAAMKTRGGGAIVLTASTNSFDGEARLTAYNASKAGLLGLLHTAANELGPYGIRVNAVCPGLIRTRLTERHFSHPDVLKSYFQHVPLGRGGEPTEVAYAAAFLASDLASYITGAALFVDGGQMASKFGPWSDEIAEFCDGAWKLR